MSHFVTGLFSSAKSGQSAADKMLQLGFGLSAVHVFSDAAAAESALVASGLSKAAAASTAAGVTGEAVLVAVAAPFGKTAEAIRHLQTYLPVSLLLHKVDSAAGSLPAAAPFSDALGLPTLSRYQGGKAAVSNAPSFPTVVSNKAGVFSGLLGLPLLSKSAAPFSKSLGLPVLTDGKPLFGSLWT